MDTLSTKTRALLLRPLKTTKVTKMAGVTHAKTLFAKDPVFAPRLIVWISLVDFQPGMSLPEWVFSLVFPGFLCVRQGWKILGNFGGSFLLFFQGGFCAFGRDGKSWVILEGFSLVKQNNQGKEGQGFGKGMSTQNFKFLGSGDSLNGRNLFTELPFL